MWRAVNVDGTPTYSFVEALEASHPGYVVRVIGGAFFLTGMLCMAWNTWRTVRQAKAEQAAAATMLKIVRRESIMTAPVDTPDGES